MAVQMFRKSIWTAILTSDDLTHPLYILWKKVSHQCVEKIATMCTRYHIRCAYGHMYIRRSKRHLFSSIIKNVITYESVIAAKFLTLRLGTIIFKLAIHEENPNYHNCISPFSICHGTGHSAGLQERLCHSRQVLQQNG